MSRLVKMIFVIILLAVAAILYLGIIEGRGIPFVQESEEWSISIYEGNPLSVSQIKSISPPVLNADKITDANAVFVADPFITKFNESYFMFFEVLKKNENGDIAVAKSKDGITWTYDRIVLDEEFHLSYPYVFEYNNTQYMIPQSSSSSVRMYKAENYPYNWTYIHDLLEGNNYTDSSLVYFENVWYLFTTTNKSNTLRLFFSDSPEGQWTEHPQSPIYSGNPKYSRGAGRITEYDRSIIRYAQDDESSYGSRIYALNITQLSKTAFKEELLNLTVLDEQSSAKWNRDGMHHISLFQLPDLRWVAAVDGKRNHLQFGWKY